MNIKGIILNNINNIKIFSVESKKVRMHCNVCNKYKKFKKIEILHIFKKTLNLSISYSKCGHEYEKNIWRRRINWNIWNSWFN